MPALNFCNFNSNMVRLRDCSGKLDRNIAGRFQFQHGTIESNYGRSPARCGLQFQFQHGTIESVQPIHTGSDQNLFQFQHGTIESLHIRKSANGFGIHFNSYMVRLRGVSESFLKRLWSISIPTWYDWELRRLPRIEFPEITFQFQHGTIESRYKNGCFGSI